MIRKNVFVLCAASFLVCFNVYAQTITTAADYFKTVSEYYGTILTYEADVDMEIASTSMYGHVSFKRPDLLRIDFYSPAEQVITFNGEILTIYLPGSSAVLQQVVQEDETGGSGTNIATPQGLSLMNRYYSVAYETGPDAVQHGDISDEKVINLILSRRNASESFRTIKLSVGENSKLIRAVEAVTNSGDVFMFLYSNYSVNNDIPGERFIYDPPSSANIYNNFLFSE